jgi:hypothetical protein
MSVVMPVIPKPEGFKPFGGKSVVMLGGYNIEAMRRWQERLRAAEAERAKASILDDAAELACHQPDVAEASKSGQSASHDRSH